VRAECPDLDVDLESDARAIYPAYSLKIPQSLKFPQKLQSQLNVRILMTQSQNGNDEGTNDQIQSNAAPVYIIHISFKSTH
jgi:hypothetical protein